MDTGDDEKFLAYEFSRYSEPGWTEEGKPMNKQVLSNKKAKRYMMDIVQKWKGLELAGNPKRSDALAEAFLAEDSRFDKSWKLYDQSDNGSGSLEIMDA